MHDIYANLIPKDKKYDQARFNENLTQRIVGKYADRIGVVSKLDMEQLIASGIDQEKMYWAPVGAELRTLPGSIKRKNIVFVGNMFYPPNYDAAKLISNFIAPAVLKRVPDAHFLLIGNAPFDIQNLPNVKFLGPQDDLASSFNTATLGIAPLNNGSGMKVKMLDYASFGLPVVGTKISAMGYDENDGFMITDDYESFVNCMIELLNNPEEASRRGRAAKAYVDREFSWEHIVDCQYKIYEAAYWDHQHGKNAMNIPVFERSDGRIEVDGFLLEPPQHLREKRYELAKPLQKDCMLEI
jgi:glycosyltransferase involved in cell wall biosynthesis